MGRKADMSLLVAILVSVTGVAAADTAVVCRGANSMECRPEGCARGENHVHMRLKPNARGSSELCIGEGCYAGTLDAVGEDGGWQGEFHGSDGRNGRFRAAIAVSKTKETATVTWGDGTTVGIVFTTCARATSE